MTIAALIVAAGRGTRAAGSSSHPKQYARLGGVPILLRALRAFAATGEVGRVQAVIHPEDGDLYRDSVSEGFAVLAPPIPGGATRQLSVLAGLEALSREAPPDLVLIHDAARPFVEPQVIRAVIAALATHPGAIAADPVTDTLKREAAGGTIAGTVDRQGLWRAQTPQGFRFPAILEAHRRAAAAGRTDFTDDAAIAEWAGLPVALVPGSSRNVKITTAEDLAIADKLLSGTLEPRTGTGFDVHRFTIGDHVWLGGVKIPHTHSLEGHSDADVALHALTDAILGALGDGDIGQHFPPSDPKWKGAASRLFLEDAGRRARERGARITNVDVTILAEAPKVGPHRQAMQAVIGAALGLTPDRIGIKATTTEGLGFTGRREGIAAMASATLLLPG